MGLFILRRTGVMILTALCLTFIVFFLTNLYPNLEKLAKTQGNFRMSDEAVSSWLTNRGYLQPLPVKYGQWLGLLPGWTTEVADGTIGRCIHGAVTAEEAAKAPRRCGILQGDWGYSTVFKEDVLEHHRHPLGADRKADVLGAGADDALGADRGGAGGDARGFGHRPLALDLLDPDHGDAGICLGRDLHRGLRLLRSGAEMVQGHRHQRHGKRQFREFLPAGADHRALRDGLYRADDPGLDDRGDDRAIHPHGPPEGGRASRTS